MAECAGDDLRPLAQMDAQQLYRDNLCQRQTDASRIGDGKDPTFTPSLRSVRGEGLGMRVAAPARHSPLMRAALAIVCGSSSWYLPLTRLLTYPPAKMNTVNPGPAISSGPWRNSAACKPRAGSLAASCKFNAPDRAEVSDKPRPTRTIDRDSRRPVQSFS